jgi:hypothetical protein
MNERELISSVRMTARGVTRRWIGAYKSVKGIPSANQLSALNVHLFILWALSTAGCPGSLRTALQAILDEWNEEAAASAHTAGINDILAERRRAGMD